MFGALRVAPASRKLEDHEARDSVAACDAPTEVPHSVLSQAKQKRNKVIPAEVILWSWGGRAAAVESAIISSVRGRLDHKQGSKKSAFCRTTALWGFESPGLLSTRNVQHEQGPGTVSPTLAVYTHHAMPLCTPCPLNIHGALTPCLILVRR